MFLWKILSDLKSSACFAAFFFSFNFCKRILVPIFQPNTVNFHKICNFFFLLWLFYDFHKFSPHNHNVRFQPRFFVKICTFYHKLLINSLFFTEFLWQILCFLTTIFWQNPYFPICYLSIKSKFSYLSFDNFLYVIFWWNLLFLSTIFWQISHFYHHPLTK